MSGKKCVKFILFIYFPQLVSSQYNNALLSLCGKKKITIRKEEFRKKIDVLQKNSFFGRVTKLFHTILGIFGIIFFLQLIFF